MWVSSSVKTVLWQASAWDRFWRDFLEVWGGSEANFLELCFGSFPYGNFHTKATSKKFSPPSGDFRPNPPKLPRSPSRSGSSQEAGRKILAWPPPAEPRGEKKLFCCANFGRWKTVKIWWKMGGETFLVGLRGAKNFSIAFRIVFRILFRVFQTVFRIDLKLFRGQIRSARVPP